MNNRFDLGSFSYLKIIVLLSDVITNTLFGYSVYAVLLFVKVAYIVALFIATLTGIVFNFISYIALIFNNNCNWSAFGNLVTAYSIIHIANVASLRSLTAFLMNYWVYKND